MFYLQLDIFPLMCAADKVSITELTLIHKIIRSVRNSHISQSDIKHIVTSRIKTLTSVLKLSTDIITSITVRLIGLFAILVIMSVSTFKTAIILYIFLWYLRLWSGKGRFSHHSRFFNKCWTRQLWEDATVYYVMSLTQ